MSENVPWTCVPGKDSEQPVHSHSLIGVIAGYILDRQECKVSSCGQLRF